MIFFLIYYHVHSMNVYMNPILVGSTRDINIDSCMYEGRMCNLHCMLSIDHGDYFLSFSAYIIYINSIFKKKNANCTYIRFKYQTQL